IKTDYKVYFRIFILLLKFTYRSYRCSYLNCNYKAIISLISENFNGRRILEIGNSAAVHYIASASACFTNIVQGQLIPDSCEKLKRWHRKEVNLDFSFFLNIVAELEGYEDNLEEGRKLLESQIRKCVKCVVPCDIHSDPILKLEELTVVEIQPPYDLIITILTLESSCPDFYSYVTALKRIHKLLKRKGGLIVGGYECEGNWKIGNKWVPCLNLNISDIWCALKLAGFGNMTFKVHYGNKPESYYKHNSFYCIAAEKL
ncbi:nicotinamide N-methyltransferase-like, partial [Stegodyphus dumicola]|uniref:nicotinamide N-methyltransferase-like n=1 Tax=Stegodyphus dumicola TaxID=202533 RepID=UPI0015AB7552